MAKKRKIQYRNNRAKSLNQENQSLQAQTQDNYETEYIKNQNETFHLSDKGDIKQNQSVFQAEKRRKKMRKQINKFHQKEKEIYDPLSKDMDNDGVIDRYDMDFRDSKVSYRTLADDEKYDNRKNNKGKNMMNM